MHLLRPHTAILLEVMLCALLMTLLATSTSLFVQHLVDSVLVHREGTLLNALGIGMVMVVVLRTLFGIVRQYLLAHIARRLDLGLICAYSRHLLQLPVKFFETRRIGEIFSRVTDAAKLREAINGTTTTAVVDAIVVVVLLAVLWMYDLPLAIAATLIAPAFVAVVAVNHPAAARHSRSAMEHAAQAAAHLVEDISGVDTIKAFNAEDRRTEQFEGRFVAFTESVFSLQKLDIRMNAAGMFITSLASVGMLWLGGQRVLSGALTIGELLFVFMLLTTLLEPLNRLATVNLKIQDALVAIDRLFQVLDLETEPRGDNRVPFKQLTRELELRNVTFSYGTRGNVLDDVTLRVPAGKTVAIVGESGCGKSTLLKLLLRFHQPNQGQKLIASRAVTDQQLVESAAKVQASEEQLRRAQLPLDEGRLAVLRQAIELVNRDHAVRTAELEAKRIAKQGEVDTATKELADLERQLQQATLHSPIDGIIIKGRYHVGDVVPNGSPVFEVAAQDGFCFESLITSEDVGLLAEGLPSRVKFDAYDYQLYGSLGGAVSFISPDTNPAVAVSPDNATSGGTLATMNRVGQRQATGPGVSYRVRVTLAGDQVGKGLYHGTVKLGMAGRVEIVTDRRTILSILLKRIRSSISLG